MREVVRDKTLELQDQEVHREMATREALQANTSWEREASTIHGLADAQATPKEKLEWEDCAVQMRHILGLEYIREQEEEPEPEASALRTLHILEALRKPLTPELEYTSEPEEEELQGILVLEYISELEEEDSGLHALGALLP